VFELPSGGPGNNAISPVAAGYHKGRWLVQWTEGSSGNRAVRVQLLGGDLKPLNDAATVSLGDQNAGGGALWVEGSHVVSLFLVHADKTHELWGAALTCPD
jgi:hypothetical protein